MDAKRSTEEKHVYTNKLINENSPYLLQHAHNPVNWYPWCDEALKKARTEDKPIFLSIGYAACHWCHVMEKESFENPAVAEILNEAFVSIKVDREQRPDLDQIYMSATTAMTGSGGWPMTVFLTPDLKPFYAGTYFPPEERYGRPGFGSLITEIADAYRNDRTSVEQMARRVAGALAIRHRPGNNRTSLDGSHLDNARRGLMNTYDPINGGFGTQPKFPHGIELAFLMKRFAATGDDRLLHAINRSLTRMARGGIYDQLGGGFHRYSVDARWLVPHFEKMLYDNGILAAVYAEAFQLTKNELYRNTVRETLDFVLREMTDQFGGFFSSLDADSEGEEGKFYVWRKAKIKQALGDDAGAFLHYYNVTDQGNFENGTNILNIDAASDQYREHSGMTSDVFDGKIEQLKHTLFAIRADRARPTTDDKILTSWNGLMISGFVRGYQITGDDRYRRAAINAADFIRKFMYDNDALIHSWRDGKISRGEFLEDYAYFMPALLDLYEITGDYDWIRLAITLAERAWEVFADDNGNLYLAPDGQADHFIRPSDVHDGALPSPGSILMQSLLRLAAITGQDKHARRAERALTAVSGMVVTMPTAMIAAVTAVEMLQGDQVELVVVGDENDRKAFLDEIHSRYLPNRVLVISSSGNEPIPLLEGRQTDGRTVAYVCRNHTCNAPAASPEQLRGQLDKIMQFKK
ncbi:MAG: thioredoxin domain-containing protein [candidate division Zixibacteria bacterium]|nr:thioredoxin domain-containing protein [candidate division Zixibacteria bacterium]